MSDTDAQKPLFQRSIGVTPAERYLHQLCDRSFLSLWSYPGIHRDQGITSVRRIGKEVCDMLVVFENHIIIFSDKYCEFPQSGDIKVDWSRWFRRAILASAKQAWGAERWIRSYPQHLYLDAACTQPFPLILPDPETAIFHRVVVAHGIAEPCRRHFEGGSGSLIIDSSIVGDQHYNQEYAEYQPFTIGRIDKDKGYIHVFDDTTLDIIMQTLDTISDFTKYLEKKERLLASEGFKIIAGGEEELLAYYLTHLDLDGRVSAQ